MTYKRYIVVNSITGFLYFFVLISPFYASENGVSLSEVGWVFTTVYAVQAVLTYTVGRIFERFPPGIGVIIGRAIYSAGPLILAFKHDLLWFTAAQIAASFFDVFFPSLVLYERAIIPPDIREDVYRKMIVTSESVKMFFLLVFVISYLRDLNVYKALFLSMFFGSMVYIFAFLVFLPRVRSGMEGASEVYDKRSLLYIYISQLFTFLSFNFASWMIVSYFLKEVLKGYQLNMLYFEMFFSGSIIVSYFAFGNRSRRINLKWKFFIGGILMSVYFFLMSFPSLMTFYISHIFVGVGFLMWLPAKETLKFQSSPKELGRWEGLFQGINILSRIVFPPLSVMVAQSISFSAVFLIGGFLALSGAITVLGVRE